MKVQAGYYYSVAMSEQGAVYSCGLNQDQRCGFPSEKDEIIKFTEVEYFKKHNLIVTDINSGGKHCVAIVKDRNKKKSLYTWGLVDSR